MHLLNIPQNKMAKGQQFNLDAFVKNADGTYSKAKTGLQPRDVKKDKNGIQSIVFKDGRYTGGPLPQLHNWTNDISIQIKDVKVTGNQIHSGPPLFRTITLNLFGIPMPKQSVRATTTGHFFQPQKTVDRTKDYIKQIKEQLPNGWLPFENEVHITKFHCIYPPLKAFHKIKGRMEAIRNGEIFYKNTRPDLCDNLHKLILDSLSGLAYKDDSIIVTENDSAKYYGPGGMIIIEMRGY